MISRYSEGSLAAASRQNKVSTTFLHCNEKTFAAARQISVFSFWVFSLQRIIFSLQRLQSVLPMPNALTKAKKSLTTVVTICLLPYWLAPLQRQIFSLQRLSKVCPQNFQAFFFFFIWANPAPAPNFLAAAVDHCCFPVWLSCYSKLDSLCSG